MEVREDTGVFVSFVDRIERESSRRTFPFLQGEKAEDKTAAKTLFFTWEKRWKTKLGFLAAYSHVLCISIFL